MRFVVACLLFAACEKAGGVETTGGTSSHDESSRPVGTQPTKIATLANDAGVVTNAADAAVVAVAPDAGSPRPPRPPRRTDDDLARQLQAEALSFADALTSEGDNGNTGDMSARRPGADLGRQIGDLRSGTGVASGGAGRGGGSVSVGTGTGPRSVDSPSQPIVSGRVSVNSKQALDDSTLTPDTVLAKIQAAYLAGIKRCYKATLEKDAAARGKLTLTLTVTESGRAVNVKASGFAQELDACVTGRMASWRFPIPKDKDGKTTQASFSIGLSLIPD